MRATSDKLGRVRQRVAKGEYRVPADRVAAAMLQKIGATVVGRGISPEAGRDRSPAMNGHPEA